MGKLLGGGLGFVIGGPLGAVLGALVGHHTLDAEDTLSVEEGRHSVFFLATFSMLGKLSKADGVVSREEIDVVEELMTEQLKLSGEARQVAIKIFTVAKSSDHTFEDYAHQFHEEFRDQPEALVSMIDLLLRLAHSDGVAHPKEVEMINQGVRIFGVEAEAAQLRARYSEDNDLLRCYEVLGASEGEPLEDIKKKYRRLAMENHPDRMQAKGVPPELMATAEDRFKEIQHAFEVVERHLRR